MTIDTRVVLGFHCTYWGDISTVSKIESLGIPCCPFCKSPLFEFENEEAFMEGSEKFGQNYVDMLKLHKNKKCYPNSRELLKNYNMTVEESKRVTLPSS